MNNKAGMPALLLLNIELICGKFIIVPTVYSEK